jgi:hypothetical protein
MEMGYSEGPVLGRILKALVELVLDDPAQNTRQSLIDYIQKHFPLTQAAEEPHERGKKTGSQEGP